jgi:hypothetical protein
VSHAIPASNRGFERRRRFRAAGTATLLAGLAGDGIMVRAVSGIWLPAADEFRLAAFQRLLWCPGSIDTRPIDRSNIIPFLQRGDFSRRVGCIAFAPADPSHSGCKIGHKEEADERNVQSACDIADRGSLGF